MEKLRESFHWLPWRPDLTKNETEEDCEDVERLVLFDDLAPMLFTLSGIDGSFDFLLKFLSFLGVNIDFDIGRNFSSQLAGMDVEQLEQLDVVPESVGIKMSCAISQTAHKFISTLFEQMMKYFDEEKQSILSLIWLKFQYKYVLKRSNNSLKKSDIKELKKFAKGLLKEKNNRNNLTVWAAYIELERFIGKPEDVRAILQTALAMFSGTAAKDYNQKAGILLLYRMYSELLLNFKACESKVSFDRHTPASPSDIRRVQSVLLCAVEETRFTVGDSELTPTIILKARKKFGSILESIENDISAISTADDFTKYYFELCSCCALFELCSSGIESSCEVYNRAIETCSKLITKEKKEPDRSEDRIVSLEKLHKKLYMVELSTLVHHMTTSNCSLCKLRNVLDRALQEFPCECCFLSMLVFVEERARIAGRVQRYFTRTLSSSQSYVPVVFAWISENRRQKLLEEQTQELSDQTKGKLVFLYCTYRFSLCFGVVAN